MEHKVTKQEIEELCNNIQKRMDETYNYYLNF